MAPATGGEGGGAVFLGEIGGTRAVQRRRPPKQPRARLRRGSGRHLDPGVHVQAPEGGARNLGIAF